MTRLFHQKGAVRHETMAYFIVFIASMTFVKVNNNLNTNQTRKQENRIFYFLNREGADLNACLRAFLILTLQD